LLRCLLRCGKSLLRQCLRPWLAGLLSLARFLPWLLARLLTGLLSRLLASLLAGLLSFLAGLLAFLAGRRWWPVQGLVQRIERASHPLLFEGRRRQDGELPWAERLARSRWLSLG